MTSTEDRIAPQPADLGRTSALIPRNLAGGLPDALEAWREAPRRGRGFSLRTLIVLRWLTILGQSAAILTAHQGLHFPLPLWSCLIVIAVSAAVNVGAMAPTFTAALADDPGPERGCGGWTPACPTVAPRPCTWASTSSSSACCWD